MDFITPNELFAVLDASIVGQDTAKWSCVRAFCWNRNRQSLIAEGLNPNQLPAKNNVLLLGPSGSGKTTIAKEMAAHCAVPFLYTSAPDYTSAGYKGSSVSEMIVGLLKVAGGNKELAEQGVIFIDEIDKISRRNFGGIDDVGGVAVQQAFLTLLEGASVEGIDTHGITFIVGGVFEGVSFTDDVDASMIPVEALAKLGFLDQFIARFPSRVALHPLSKADLRSILLESETSVLNRYTVVARRYGVDLYFHRDAVTAIVDLAARVGTGARALNDVVTARLGHLLQEFIGHAGKPTQRLTVEERHILHREPLTLSDYPSPLPELPNSVSGSMISRLKTNRLSGISSLDLEQLAWQPVTGFPAVSVKTHESRIVIELSELGILRHCRGDFAHISSAKAIRWSFREHIFKKRKGRNEPLFYRSEQHRQVFKMEDGVLYRADLPSRFEF